MSIQMVQHLSQESELTHEEYGMEGKADGHAEGPPNFEQPIGVRENNGNSFSHIFEIITNQHHDIMLDEL